MRIAYPESEVAEVAVTLTHVFIDSVNETLLELYPEIYGTFTATCGAKALEKIHALGNNVTKVMNTPL